MDTLVNLWWEWMTAMLWQVSLLVVILAVLDLLIRRWVWPQVRHALWLLVLVKLVIPPGLSLPGGVLPAAVATVAANLEVGRAAEPPASALDRTPASSPSMAGGTFTRADGGTAIDRGAAETAPTARPWWPAIAFFVWLAGAIALATVLALRMRRLARWHREQEARPTIPEWFHEILIDTSERLGLERVPAIVFSDQAVTPAVYGLLRPVLLLPAHYTDSLSRSEAEHVLLHEMAHLKRGDLIVHALFLVLQLVYWFNPFVAFARRQVKHVREICCDLTVAGLLRERTPAYRKTLVDTARHLLSESLQPGMGLVGVFEEPYKVVARMRWLERPTWEYRRLMIASAWGVLLLAAPTLLPMAADRPAEAASARLAAADLDASSLSAAPQAEGSDTYVRNVLSLENLLLGVRISSQQTEISETWVAEDRISVTERGRTVIYDRTLQRITLVDHRSESWVESTLPLDVTAVLGDDLQRQRRGIRTTGEVEETGRSRRILGRRCPEYRVSSWNSSAGSLSNPTTLSVWASTDVPFDLRLLDEVLLDLRLLYNRDANYRRELEKIRGLQMRLELRRGSIWASKRWLDEVVEISSQVPPPGTYEPPPGYRRLDRFEHLEF